MIPPKAFLLAAGRGERLRPLTDSIPKCLVPVGGKPLLRIWLDLFDMHGITNVLINLNHLPEAVTEFVEGYRGAVDIQMVYENTLLGSAGTVRENHEFVEGEESFWVCYADNLTTADLTSMAHYHNRHLAPVTLGLFETDRPKECGIVELDDAGYVVNFTEKPVHPKSNLANGGLFLCRRELFDYLPQKEVVDFGFDVFPHLKMAGHKIKGILMDVGSPEKYEQAQKTWKALN